MAENPVQAAILPPRESPGTMKAPGAEGNDTMEHEESKENQPLGEKHGAEKVEVSCLALLSPPQVLRADVSATGGQRHY